MLYGWAVRISTVNQALGGNTGITGAMVYNVCAILRTSDFSKIRIKSDFEDTQYLTIASEGEEDTLSEKIIQKIQVPLLASQNARGLYYLFHLFIDNLFN